MSTPGAPWVIVTRHPDVDNEYAVFGGKANIVTLDYGADFDSIPSDLAVLDGWAEGVRSQIDEDAPVQVIRFVESAISQLREDADL